MQFLRFPAADKQLIRETESLDYNMLHRRLQEIAVRTSKQNGSMERKLKYSRLVEAHCNLKSLILRFGAQQTKATEDQVIR
ncbi:hypothetical protein EON65_52990 [archaeon]|nr:MAG: hypothetical protein EON65_52990 [archaeon]